MTFKIDLVITKSIY